MSDEMRLALIGGVVPGLLTGVAMLAAWLLWSRKRIRAAQSSADIPDSIRREPFGPVWVGPLVLAAGFVLADSVTNGWPQRWPDNNTYRYPHAAGLLALLGLLESIWTSRAFVREATVSIARAAVLAACVWLIGEGYYDAGSRTADQFFGWMAIASLGGAVVMRIADAGAGVLSARALGPVLALLAGAAMPLLFLTGSALLTRTTTSVVAFACAATLAAWLVWFLTRSRDGKIPIEARLVRLDRGATTVLVGLVIVSAAGVAFQTYPEAKGAPSLVLLGLAPAMLGVLCAGGDTFGRAARTRIVSATALVLLTLAVALGIAQLAQPAPEESGDDPSYEYYPG
ncbi:MAG: hypothetical protein ACF8Q5_11695 [Phycisphaerales bacterium JB040]